jgi:LysM repeat protein
MEPNDSNNKAPQTGGLKLMTVFIFVLALHVVVIGGFTVYHLMSGGSADADLTTTDKAHKGLKNADGMTTLDGALPDASQADKTAASTPAPAPAATEVTAIPANPPTPAPETVAPAENTTPAPAPGPAPTPALSPAPTVTTPPMPAAAPAADVASQVTPGPINPIPPALAPPPDFSQPPAPMASTPDVSQVPAATAPPPDLTAATPSGPVHMPSGQATAAADEAPAHAHEAAAPAHTHAQIYVVKITDSYKKIAHGHHVTVAQLKEANHIHGDVLHTGQKLIIPSSGTAVAESGSSSATSAGSTLSNLAASPSFETAASLHHHVYTVVKGDTLIKIARRFKTTATALMAENSIVDPGKLSIGKRLKIPAEESRSVRNSPPASAQPGQVQAKENAPAAQLANFVP